MQVAKPDQLIKRRGKAGLLAVNKSWTEVQAWIAARMGTEQQVEVVTGRHAVIMPGPAGEYAEARS